MGIQCLDHEQIGSIAEQIDIDAIRGKRGAELAYSHRLGEWIIIARDAPTKERLQQRYGSGLGVYTIDEGRLLVGASDEELVGLHQLVTSFGAWVQDYRREEG